MASGKVMAAPDGAIPFEVDLFGDGNGLAVQIDETIGVVLHKKLRFVLETEIFRCRANHLSGSAVSIQTITVSI